MLTPAHLASLQNDEDGTDDPKCEMHTWPYLYVTTIPAWNLVIEGHRKIIDDKLRLVGLQDGDVLALDQTESALMAAIPSNSDDDTENFLVGMALDYCCSVSKMPFHMGINEWNHVVTYFVSL